MVSLTCTEDSILSVRCIACALLVVALSVFPSAGRKLDETYLKNPDSQLARTRLRTTDNIICSYKNGPDYRKAEQLSSKGVLSHL
jgi:hypothetical protein